MYANQQLACTKENMNPIFTVAIPMSTSFPIAQNLFQSQFIESNIFSISWSAPMTPIEER